MATDKDNGWNETALNKRQNYSSCTKLALIVSRAHGMIAHSVKSYSGELCIYIYIYIYRYVYIYIYTYI